MLDQTGGVRQVVKLSRGQPTSDGAGVKLNRVIGNRGENMRQIGSVLGDDRGYTYADDDARLQCGELLNKPW